MTSKDDLNKMTVFYDEEEDEAVEVIVRHTIVSPLINEGYCSKVSDFNPSMRAELSPWINALTSLGNEFRHRYKEPLNKMAEDLMKQNGYPLILPSLVIGVGNDLFSQGITWSCIISFFAFTTELISVCLSRGDVPKDVILRIERFVIFYVKRSLLPWINDHGSWDGLVNFAKMREPGKIIQKSLVKNVFEGAIKVFGVFAWAANATTTH